MQNCNGDYVDSDASDEWKYSSEEEEKVDYNGDQLQFS